MTEQWQPSGPWKRRFRQALDGAFNEASMELLTSDYFSPILFSKVASPGLNKTFDVRLQELIEAARMNDWLLDLVAAAHEVRPKNAAIGAIAEELGLTITGPRFPMAAACS